MEKVEYDFLSGCVLWTAGLDAYGYALLLVGGRDGRQERVHRLTWELVYGPIPDGLVIDHLCRVRHCVNPDHLEPVTNEENIERGHRARRESGLCRHGHSMADAYLLLSGPEKGRRYCRTCAKASALRTWHGGYGARRNEARRVA